MDAAITRREQENEKKGRLAGGIAFAVIVVLLFLPIIFYQTPPPGQEGILVNLGLPDLGQGTDNAGPSAPAEASEPILQPEPTPPEPTPAEPTPVTPQPQQREVVTQEDPEQIALQRQREQEARERAEAQRRQQEAEAQRRAQQEAERRRQEEARRRAAEEAARKAEAERTKNQIGGLFGSGGGKGNTGQAGNQGDPGGDPNASNLEGISTGSGRVGGGLGGRGIISAPSVEENSQKQGVVVVNVCVGANGSVVSAEFTQRGSTTTDRQLVQAALRNARSWRFSRGEIDKQCGTISYNFKVR